MKKLMMVMISIMMAAGSAMACSGQGGGDPLVKKVFSALSHLELSADDIKDVKLSAKIYRQDMAKVRMEGKFPVDAFGKEELDKEKYVAHLQKQNEKKALIKYDFLDAVYTILDAKNKPKFVEEMKAISNMQRYFGNGGGMGMNGCGQKGGNAGCDGSGPKGKKSGC